MAKQASESINTEAAPFTTAGTEHAQRALNSISNKAAKAEEELRLRAASSKSTISETSEEMKQKMSQSATAIQQKAKEKPLVTLGLAFATGALVSHLLRKGS